MPLDYDSYASKILTKNRADVIRAMENGELDTKINNFCNKHGFPRSQVMDEIRKNKIVAAIFCKDPTRQRIHEKLAAEYIKK